MDDSTPQFCIGHHESKRAVPVSSQTVQVAHEINYDIVTSPITTPHFHSRVLALLAASLSEAGSNTHHSYSGISHPRNLKPLSIPPLSPVDTYLTPDESMSQIVGVTSSWTDLCSPDSAIAAVSQEILKLEVAYAAFCGISYLLIPGPRLRRSSLHDGSLSRYARAILDALSAGPYIQIQIWLPMIDHPENVTEEVGDLAPFSRSHLGTDDGEEDRKKLDLFGTWAAWDVLRSMCKYHSRLCVALSLPKLLPPVPIQTRWHSEPVRMLTLNGDTFTRNPKGYPVLSKAHQAFVSRLMRLRTRPWLLLCDVGSLPMLNDLAGGAMQDTSTSPSGTANFPTPSEAFSQAQIPERFLKDPTPHLSYLRNLQTRQPQQSQIERFGAGYQDYLQAPLQPLTVNLESITYEVFEKDPVKYDWYEKAVARALHDWIQQGKPTSNTNGRVVVAVVGAGRGPLVTRALKASRDVGVEIDMWALEKNPNAFVLLQRHNENIWDNQVKLVKSDMRSWQGPVMQTPQPMSPTLSAAPADPTSSYTGDPDVDRDYLLATKNSTTASYPVDILISELLGSFADNELCPECLDGVQHLLNPTHGISIPASYTAHLTPISAPKLHADIVNQSISNPNAPETPFVVMLHAVDYLSTTTPPEAAAQAEASVKSPQTAKPPRPVSLPPTAVPSPVVKAAWSFSHPNTSVSLDSNIHNTRHSTTHFPIPYHGVCHGLAGYFEAVLYPEIELSTNPATMDEKSEGMISWFPIYFPLKTPVYVPDNGEVVVNMWRQSDDRKVWYEWVVDVYAGYREKGKETRTFRVGGSELHSSVKEACLM